MEYFVAKRFGVCYARVCVWVWYFNRLNLNIVREKKNAMKILLRPRLVCAPPSPPPLTWRLQIGRNSTWHRHYYSVNQIHTFFTRIFPRRAPTILRRRRTTRVFGLCSLDLRTLPLILNISFVDWNLVQQQLKSAVVYYNLVAVRDVHYYPAHDAYELNLNDYSSCTKTKIPKRKRLRMIPPVIFIRSFFPDLPPTLLIFV